MGDEHKLYSKTEGSRDSIEIKKEISVLPIESSEIPIVDIPISYSKQDGTFSPALFVIVSGGIRREEHYFHKISDINVFPRIKVQFIAKNKETGEEGLSPKKVFDEAVKIKNYYEEGKPTDIEDNIYLVVDVDDFMAELLDIKPLCKEEKLNLIISNSCLEIWLYYGHESKKPNDFQIPSKIDKISSAFKTYLGTKVNGGVNPLKAIFNIENAIKNSEANYEEDENGIPTLFSTNMFVLGKQLVELIKPELEELKKQDKLRVEQYKKKLAD